MHFEILVEDKSGKHTLEIIVPKIIGDEHTYRVHPYKGIGKIPKGMTVSSDASNRILLSQLPKLLRGYGKTFASYPDDYSAVVVLVCDLDDKCIKKFRRELFQILDTCEPKPNAKFCFAIEEGEAWLLGDLAAIKEAYPRAKDGVLNSYKNDSICGTWECLADAIYPGGSAALRESGWRHIGLEKSSWAKKISPHMNVYMNNSPSFCYFRDKLKELIEN